MLNGCTVAGVCSIVKKCSLLDSIDEFEHGDADSSGSTLRTLGIVVLVLAVVALIGGAVFALAGQVAGAVGSTNYPW